jgi:hypothetical protein
VYFADQGIEVCTRCSGCICCDHVEVDHDAAPRLCLRLDDGTCGLTQMHGHDCAASIALEAALSAEGSS